MNSPIHMQFSIDCMKHTVQQVFTERNEEFSKMVTEELDKELNLGMVQFKIREQVRLLVDNAIKEIGNSYKLRTLVTNIIEDSLVNVIKTK